MSEDSDRRAARRVVFANQKGGVGKTTTAVNLSAALAATGEPTLLIDLDAQGNASTGLGVERNAEGRAGAYELLSGELGVRDVVSSTRIPLLDCVAGGESLYALDAEGGDDPSRLSRLSSALDVLDGDGLTPVYRYVLLDCPPALNGAALNGMIAAESLIVPMQCEYYSLEGLSQLLRTTRKVRDSRNPRLSLEGIVLTMFDRRNSLSKQVEEDVRGVFGDRVYETAIPRNVRVSEAPSHGEPALIYDRHCAGSRAYIALASEFSFAARSPISTTWARRRSRRGLVSPPRGSDSRRLGRGLAALLGGDDSLLAEGRGRESSFSAPIESVSPNPENPRGRFPRRELEEMSATIRRSGILQPLLAREATPEEAEATGGARYVLIAGERRWRAAQLAKLDVVPLVTRRADEVESLELALIENLQRSAISPIDEARAYRRLLERGDATQESIARAVGRSRAHVANTTRLLELPRSVRESLDDGRLTAGHGRALLGSSRPESLAEEAIRRRLSVRAVERRVAAERDDVGKGEGGASSRRRRVDPTMEDLARRLAACSGCRVDLRYDDGRGTGEL